MHQARQNRRTGLTLPALLALMGLAATACGQKGPLVLPKAATAAGPAASAPAR